MLKLVVIDTSRWSLRVTRPKRPCYTNSYLWQSVKTCSTSWFCPLCKATVELKQDQSGLKCVECKRVYPVRDDIPVMLVDEARVEA